MLPKKSLIPVVAGSTAGALVEFYDFYIYGALAVVLSTKFFPKEDAAAAFLATLATFAAGMLVRPFGALFFGRLGDLLGRRYTFVFTLFLIGGSTFMIGLIPSYTTIGFWSPLLVLISRLLQGLAIGGEFGGAATFVAEHAPDNRRGFWTSWITTVSGAGMVMALAVISFVKGLMSSGDWENWGWRLPFLLSGVLVFLSITIRRNLPESPLFTRAKAGGNTSLNPIKDAFSNRANLKIVILALFGLTLGVGVVGYSSIFFIQSFLIKFLFVDDDQANRIIAIGLASGIPLYVFFGWLSDRIGRKPLLMLSLLLGIICFRPIFDQVYRTVDLQHKTLLKTYVVRAAEDEHRPGDGHMMVSVKEEFYTDGTRCTVVSRLAAGTVKAQVTKKVNINVADTRKLILLIFLLMIIVTASAGTSAAYLVDMFPLKIRYTSLSLPYHIGYGIFGGMSPVISAYLIERALAAHQADYYLAGLNYPIILMSVSLLIGAIYLEENAGEHVRPTSAVLLKNKIKRFMGFGWLLLALLAGYVGIFIFGIPKIASGKPDDLIFGVIVLLVVSPLISGGLFVFARYSINGAYDGKVRALKP